MSTLKKKYETPCIDVVRGRIATHLLDWSAPKGVGPGEGHTVEIEAKKYDVDAFDYLPKKFHDMWDEE